MRKGLEFTPQKMYPITAGWTGGAGGSRGRERKKKNQGFIQDVFAGGGGGIMSSCKK